MTSSLEHGLSYSEHDWSCSSKFQHIPKQNLLTKNQSHHLRLEHLKICLGIYCTKHSTKRRSENKIGKGTLSVWD